MNAGSGDEVVIRELLERWATAVRASDYKGILAHHSDDIVMFDVPPPFESRGLEEYRKSWDLFFSVQPVPITFDIERINIVAGADVAFAVALMRCRELGEGGMPVDLGFRLTVGLRKLEGQWTVVHEHHSIPATDGPGEALS